jgi:preprotein translocase subunit SecD
VVCCQKSQREVLDETGGLEFVLKVDWDKAAALEKGQEKETLEKKTIKQAAEIVGKRLDLAKVDHYIDILPPGDRFRVRLRPKDPVHKRTILWIIRAAGNFQFLPVAGESQQSREMLLEERGGTLREGEQILKLLWRPEYCIVSQIPLITGSNIAKSELGKDNYGETNIQITLDDAGTKKMKNFSSMNIGKKLALVLDEYIVAAPSIQDVISHSFVIFGSFGEDFTLGLQAILKEGVLPAPLKLISEDVFKGKGE